MQHFLKLALAISMAGLLAACGGGGDSSSTDSGAENQVPVSTPATSSGRISSALANGDVSGLETADMSTILDQAITDKLYQLGAEFHLWRWSRSDTEYRHVNQ